MEAIEDVVRDAFERHERGADMVRELLEREGASNIVKTVARLAAARARHYEEAFLFLADGLELPALRSEIQTDPDLRSALASMLTSPDVRDRRSAIWALRMLPIASSSEMLASAADAFLREGDIISLSQILAVLEAPAIVAQMVSSDDWLVRWAVLAWTNSATDSPLADRLRRQLAADQNVLVAREASQHIEVIETFAKRAASTEGWTFGVVSNHGPAPTFRDLTSRFMEGWPAEKASYSLDELRTFITRATAKTGGAAS